MDQDELVQVVSETFERLSLPYFVTGSVATIYYGEPRFTNDIDIVTKLAPAHVEALCAAFAPPDYYLERETVLRALTSHGQCNIIHLRSGLKVDIMIPALDAYNLGRFARARQLPLGTGRAAFASPEDVILKKLEAHQEGGSEKHLRDIAGILRVSGARLDREYLDLWASRRGLLELWRACLDRLGL